jgi:hypothetical protein
MFLCISGNNEVIAFTRGSLWRQNFQTDNESAGHTCLVTVTNFWVILRQALEVDGLSSGDTSREVCRRFLNWHRPTQHVSSPIDSNWIKPLKPKLVWIIFKNSVRTAKKTQHFSIARINWLTLFKEVIAVYSENHTRPINTKCRSYWLLKQAGHIITTRLLTLMG